MNIPTFTYTDNEGNKTQVELERWAWGVLYKDGTELHQFSDDGIFHRIGEVDQSKIKMFSMYKPLGEDNKRIDMPFVDGMRLIHKYRNIRPYYKDHFEKVYLFGYKFEGRYSYYFILPDDRVIISPVENIDLSQFGV